MPTIANSIVRLAQPGETLETDAVIVAEAEDGTRLAVLAMGWDDIIVLAATAAGEAIGKEIGKGMSDVIRDGLLGDGEAYRTEVLACLQQIQAELQKIVDLLKTIPTIVFGGTQRALTVENTNTVLTLLDFLPGILLKPTKDSVQAAFNVNLIDALTAANRAMMVDRLAYKAGIYGTAALVRFSKAAMRVEPNVWSGRIADIAKVFRGYLESVQDGVNPPETSFQALRQKEEDRGRWADDWLTRVKIVFDPPRPGRNFYFGAYCYPYDERPVVPWTVWQGELSYDTSTIDPNTGVAPVETKVKLITTADAPRATGPGPEQHKLKEFPGVSPELKGEPFDDAWAATKMVEKFREPTRNAVIAQRDVPRIKPLYDNAIDSLNEARKALLLLEQLPKARRR